MADQDSELLEQIRTGKKRIVTNIEYLFNRWSPIFTIISVLVAGIFWFANANGRMFTNETIRYETETNTINAKQRTLDKLDERYVKVTEFKEFKKTLEVLNENIVELKIELAKARR